MKKKHKKEAACFMYRSLHRREKMQRWSLVAGIIFCTLLLVSLVKVNNISGENLHHSACTNEIAPLYLSAQGSFVPEEITFDFNFDPESVELVEFFPNDGWLEASRSIEDGHAQFVVELNDREVKRDFATAYLRVNADNVVKYEITEKSGETVLTTGFDQFLVAEKDC